MPLSIPPATSELRTKSVTKQQKTKGHRAAATAREAGVLAEGEGTKDAVSQEAPQEPSPQFLLKLPPGLSKPESDLSSHRMDEHKNE